jgi:DNA repair exonuclease SbcCD ATPase subunit
MTGRPTNEDIYEKLGGLINAVNTIKDDVRGLKAEIERADERAVQSYERSETRAAASRAKIYEKTDELVERVSATEKNVAALTTTVEEVKEVTDQVKRWELMGMGALGVTGIAAGAVASLLTYYWQKIVAAITG